MSDRLAVFRDGTIEQVGPPAEVYERPATEFVASFVGTSNVIDTPTGTAVLRPEKIELSRGTALAGRPGAEGRIVDVAYLGMVTRFTVDPKMVDDDRRSPESVRRSKNDSLDPRVDVTFLGTPTTPFPLRQRPTLKPAGAKHRRSK